MLAIIGSLSDINVPHVFLVVKIQIHFRSTEIVLLGTVPSQKRRKRGFRKQYILYGLSQKCQHLVVDVSLVC